LARLSDYFLRWHRGVWVYDYVPGHDLTDWIPWVMRPPTKPEIRCAFFCQVVTQVLQGVMYLYDQGWQHGDIHPRNIRLDNHLKITLVDFGSAQCLKHSPLPKLISSRQDWTAPESLERGSLSNTGDFYAFSTLVLMLAHQLGIHEATLLRALVETAKTCRSAPEGQRADIWAAMHPHLHEITAQTQLTCGMALKALAASLGKTMDEKRPVPNPFLGGKPKRRLSDGWILSPLLMGLGLFIPTWGIEDGYFIPPVSQHSRSTGPPGSTYPRAESRISFLPSSPPSQTSRVLVILAQPWSFIWINGKPLGQTPVKVLTRPEDFPLHLEAKFSNQTLTPHDMPTHPAHPWVLHLRSDK
jgi:serine/threonine protein kinase